MVGLRPAADTGREMVGREVMVDEYRERERDGDEAVRCLRKEGE